VTLGMKFEVHPYQAGRWTDPETPSEARRGSAVFNQAGRRRGSDIRDASFWRSTLELLDDELRQLGLTGIVVIEAGFADWDLRTDLSGPLARVRESHPGVVVSFTSRVWGPMRYATDMHEVKYSGDPPGWQANVRAVALTLGALRAIDRWGVARRGEQYTGFKALPAGGTGLTFPSADAALRWMTENKPKGFTGDTAAELYRALARRMHPDSGKHDAGWEPDDWTRLENAKLLLTTAKMI
jgi:hypothetical protein